jgi:hypothetical protein
MQNTINNTPKVVLNAIKEATNKLVVTGCSFKVILPNGEEQIHDPHNLLNPVKKITRKVKDRPYGSLLAHYKPFVDSMNVGDVVVVPRNEFTFQELQSAITAWCGHKWGNGSVTTSKNKDDDTVEVLRLK